MVPCPPGAELPGHSSMGLAEPLLSCFHHRVWNKETFDYLLGHLGSPAATEMGLFLVSGYNLFAQPVPVRSSGSQGWEGLQLAGCPGAGGLCSFPDHALNASKSFQVCLVTVCPGHGVFCAPNAMSVQNKG